MILGEDLQKDLRRASELGFKTLVRTAIYWIEAAYNAGYVLGAEDYGGCIVEGPIKEGG